MSNASALGYVTLLRPMTAQQVLDLLQHIDEMESEGEHCELLEGDNEKGRKWR